MNTKSYHLFNTNLRNYELSKHLLTYQEGNPTRRRKIGREEVERFGVRGEIRLEVNGYGLCVDLMMG